METEEVTYLVSLFQRSRPSIPKGAKPFISPAHVLHFAKKKEGKDPIQMLVDLDLSGVRSLLLEGNTCELYCSLHESDNGMVIEGAEGSEDPCTTDCELVLQESADGSTKTTKTITVMGDKRSVAVSAVRAEGKFRVPETGHVRFVAHLRAKNRVPSAYLRVAQRQAGGLDLRSPALPMTTTRDRAYPLAKPHVGRWDASSEIAKDVLFPWLAAGADPGNAEAERSRRSTLMPSRVAHLFIALRGDDRFRETTDHYLEEARKEAHPLAAFFIDVLHVLIAEKYTINTDGPWPEAARYLLRRRRRRRGHYTQEH